ncbi:hypothetical protein [Mycoplasma sp. 4044]
MKKTKKMAIILSILSTLVIGGSVAYVIASRSHQKTSALNTKNLDKTLQEVAIFLTENNSNNEYQELNQKYESVIQSKNSYTNQSQIEKDNNDLTDLLAKAKENLAYRTELREKQKQAVLQPIEENTKVVTEIDNFIKDNQNNLSEEEKQQLTDFITKNKNDIAKASENNDADKIQELTKELNDKLSNVKSQMTQNKEVAKEQSRSKSSKASELIEKLDENQKEQYSNSIESNTASDNDNLKAIIEKNKDLDKIISDINNQIIENTQTKEANDASQQQAQNLLESLSNNTDVDTHSLKQKLQEAIEKNNSDFVNSSTTENKKQATNNLNTEIEKIQKEFESLKHRKAVGDANKLIDSLSNSDTDSNLKNKLQDILKNNSVASDGSTSNLEDITKKINKAIEEIKNIQNQELQEAKNNLEKSLDKAQETLKFLEELNKQKPSNALSENIEKLKKALQDQNTVDAKNKQALTTLNNAINQAVEDANNEVKDLQQLAKSNYDKLLTSVKELRKNSTDENLNAYLDKVIEDNSNLNNPTTLTYNKAIENLENASARAQQAKGFNTEKDTILDWIDANSSSVDPKLITDLKDKLKDISKNFDNNFNNQNSKASDLSNQVQALKDALNKAKLENKKNELDNLQSKVNNELKDNDNDPKIKAIKDEYDKLLEKVRNLNTESQISDETVKQLEETTDKLKQQLAKSLEQQKGNDLIAKAKQLLDGNSSLNQPKAKKELSQKLGTLKQKIENNEISQEDLGKAVEDLNKAIDDAQKTNSDLNLKDKIEETNKVLENLPEEYKTKLKEKIKEVQNGTKLEDLDKDQIDKLLNDLDQSLNKAKVDNSKEILDKELEKINQLTENNAELNQKAKELADKAKKLASQDSISDAEIKKLEEEIKELDHDIDKQKGKELIKDIEDFVNSPSSNQNPKTEMTKLLDEAKDSIESSKTSPEELKQKLQDLKNAYTNAQNENANINLKQKISDVEAWLNINSVENNRLVNSPSNSSGILKSSLTSLNSALSDAKVKSNSNELNKDDFDTITEDLDAKLKRVRLAKIIESINVENNASLNKYVEKAKQQGYLTEVSSISENSKQLINEAQIDTSQVVNLENRLDAYNLNIAKEGMKYYSNKVQNFANQPSTMQEIKSKANALVQELNDAIGKENINVSEAKQWIGDADARLNNLEDENKNILKNKITNLETQVSSWLSQNAAQQNLTTTQKALKDQLNSTQSAKNSNSAATMFESHQNLSEKFEAAKIELIKNNATLVKTNLETTLSETNSLLKKVNNDFASQDIPEKTNLANIRNEVTQAISEASYLINSDSPSKEKVDVLTAKAKNFANSKLKEEQRLNNRLSLKNTIASIDGPNDPKLTEFINNMSSKYTEKLNDPNTPLSELKDIANKLNNINNIVSAKNTYNKQANAILYYANKYPGAAYVSDVKWMLAKYNPMANEQLREDGNPGLIWSYKSKFFHALPAINWANKEGFWVADALLWELRQNGSPYTQELIEAIENANHLDGKDINETNVKEPVNKLQREIERIKQLEQERQEKLKTSEQS